MRENTIESLLSEYPGYREYRKRIDAYRDRIESLREDGEEDGVFINPESEMDFWEFIGPAERPVDSRLPMCEIVLLEHGNLRGIWASDVLKRSLSIQFLGNGQGQYVSMCTLAGTEKEAPEETIYNAGRTSLNWLRGIVRLFSNTHNAKKDRDEIRKILEVLEQNNNTYLEDDRINRTTQKYE